MADRTVTVGIVGCGNIAGAYASDLRNYPFIKLAGVTDLDQERAERFAEQHATRAYPSLEALLADPAVELVVNLTIHHAHYEVTTRCLEAGKHVYSEKPLALTPAEARALNETAARRGVRLGCSPFTWMGEAQQTAWRTIRSGQLGPIRLIYAEVNWGRIESWHPNPAPFYDVGVLWDVGVYPLTMLTAFLGPVRRVWAQGRVLYPNRVTQSGAPFQISTPDCTVALIDLEQGATVRLTANFYVRTSQQNSGIEFHGDLGSLHISSWQVFDAWVGQADFGKPLAPLELARPAPQGTPWGRGVADLAEALLEGRPHRATGEHAAHVVEVLAAIDRSAQTGQAVEVASSFPPPAPLPWAE